MKQVKFLVQNGLRNSSQEADRTQPYTGGECQKGTSPAWRVPSGKGRSNLGHSKQAGLDYNTEYKVNICDFPLTKQMVAYKNGEDTHFSCRSPVIFQTGRKALQVGRCYRTLGQTTDREGHIPGQSSPSPVRHPAREGRMPPCLGSCHRREIRMETSIPGSMAAVSF